MKLIITILLVILPYTSKPSQEYKDITIETQKSILYHLTSDIIFYNNIIKYNILEYKNIRLLSKISIKYRIRPEALINYIRKESNFIPHVINQKSGASGLFQLYCPNNKLNRGISKKSVYNQIIEFDKWLSGYNIKDYKYDDILFYRTLAFGEYNPTPIEKQIKFIKHIYLKR